MTPDPYGAFPRLSPEQIGALDVHGQRRRTQVGDVLFREGDPGGDFFVPVVIGQHGVDSAGRARWAR